ncbi:hypothetical protein [Bradyrhizobium sp. 18]|uniref:hypothetical protein n=1 Tax=Bradyrhizobium sp. 18 TaxID=2782657 RepID=UPI001FF909F0|nr:hypothetical protein [Bradyrhizobium sp. 18]
MSAKEEWVKTSSDFPSWNETGHIEAKMRDGRVLTGWIVGYDTEHGDAVFEFELDGASFGSLADILEYRPIP